MEFTGNSCNYKEEQPRQTIENCVDYQAESRFAIELGVLLLVFIVVGAKLSK